MPTFKISVPPSVNAMYRNVAGVGRVKTAAYKKWQRAELLALKAQRARPVETPVTVSIIRPSKCRADADNTFKGVLDLLVTARVILDDGPKYVQGLSVTFAPIDLMEVTIESCFKDDNEVTK